jgi:rubredoxin
MKCEVCGHNPANGGPTIHRVSPIGQLPARWRCYSCMTIEQQLAIDQTVKENTDCISYAHGSPLWMDTFRTP